MAAHTCSQQKQQPPRAMCGQCAVSGMAGTDPSSLQIWLFLAGGGCLGNPLRFAPAGRHARAALFPARAPWHSRASPILGLTGCTRGCLNEDLLSRDCQSTFGKRSQRDPQGLLNFIHIVLRMQKNVIQYGKRDYL